MDWLTYTTVSPAFIATVFWGAMGIGMFAAYFGLWRLLDWRDARREREHAWERAMHPGNAIPSATVAPSNWMFTQLNSSRPRMASSTLPEVRPTAV